MAAPRKYSEELKDRETWMAVEARRDPGRGRGQSRGSGSNSGSILRRYGTEFVRPRLMAGIVGGTTTEDRAWIVAL